MSKISSRLIEESTNFNEIEEKIIKLAFAFSRLTCG